MKNTGIFYAMLFFLFTFQGKAQISYQSMGIGGGGALFSPAISPHNSQETWISCDMSGVYKSGNFGQSWDLQNAKEFRATLTPAFSLQAVRKSVMLLIILPITEVI